MSATIAEEVPTKAGGPAETAVAPRWWDRLRERYANADAHTFILHGAVDDYVAGRTRLPQWLDLALEKLTGIVVHYDVAGGVRFLTPAMGELAALMRPGAGKPAAGGDAMLAALGSLGGAPGGGGQGGWPREPAAALAAIGEVLSYDGPHPTGGRGMPAPRVAVILEYAEATAPAGEWPAMREGDRVAAVTLQRWALDQEIARVGHLILLIARAPGDLHASLRGATSGIPSIELPPADSAMREAFIGWFLREDREKAAQDPAHRPLEMAMSPGRLAAAASGLGLAHMDDILYQGMRAGALTLDLARRRKKELVAAEFGELLEIAEPRFGFEAIGGMEHLKEFFRRSIVRPLAEGRTGRVPLGVLLSGPPGTGKSAMAEAVAREAGVNYVILRMGKLLGSYVGQSEKNLDRALRAIEALAPGILLIDEIDQSLPGRSSGGGDSGVGGRVFGRFLDFLSDPDHRGRIVTLAASNRPDKLDAALRRPGRFDKKIPFLVPDEAERAGILAVLASRHGLGLGGGTPAATAAATEGWTGAELEGLVQKAIELAEDEGLGGEEALTRALGSIRRSTADVEFLTAIAIAECNDTDLLPPRLRQAAALQAAEAEAKAATGPGTDEADERWTRRRRALG